MDGISLPAFSLDNFVYRDDQIAKVLDIYAYFATCCKRGGADPNKDSSSICVDIPR
jgi:hypothetical protein